MQNKALTDGEMLMAAIKTAGHLEDLPWWRSKIKDLTPICCTRVNGQARRYYKERNRFVCWYRVIPESELYRGQ